MKRKPGRPRTLKRDITKTTQEGLAQGWTRATFIVREDYLKKVQEAAKRQNKKIKDIVDEAFSIYLEGKNE